MKKLTALALTVLAPAALAVALHENSPKYPECETIESSIEEYDNCTPCRALALTLTQKTALADLRSN